MHVKHLYFICAMGISNHLIAEQPTPAPQENIYQWLAQENNKALPQPTTTETGLCATVNAIDEKGYDQVAQAKFEQQLNQKPEDRRRAVFKLLSTYEAQHPLPINHVLDYNSIRDLELLCGPRSNPGLYLAACIDRTKTEMGRVSLYRKLIQPTADIASLRAQQEAVKTLIHNNELYDQLTQALNTLVTPENLMLSLWDAEDLFAYHASRDKVALPALHPKIKALEHWINTSPNILEARSIALTLSGYAFTATTLYNSVGVALYALTHKRIIKTFANDPTTYVGRLCQEMDKSRLARVTTGIAAGVFTWFTLYMVTYGYKISKTFDRCIHQRLNYISQYLRTAQALTQLVAQEPELVRTMPAVVRFKQVMDSLAHNPELKLLVELLQTNTITQPHTFLFQHEGRILTAYLLLLQHRDELVDAMLAIGEIDAQLSIATLYKEFQNKRVTFCFPQYVEQTDGPLINASNFWTPFIDAQRVVANSLDMGGALPRNAIITGPNAGGKSTITKALIISMVMAQSIGIAPAQALVCTPFTNIITYLNITDDIAAANSHFKAGVLRARKVVQTMQNLAPTHYGLTAIDEVFNGTTFVEGQAAAYSLLNTLGELPNSMCITCTHFPLVPQLETTGLFANHKVSVIEEPGKPLQYPFVLESGTSHQVITLRILREEGFSDQFLDQAERLVTLHKDQSHQ